jgi:hypothetical protein
MVPSVFTKEDRDLGEQHRNQIEGQTRGKHGVQMSVNRGLEGIVHSPVPSKSSSKSNRLQSPQHMRNTVRCMQHLHTPSKGE